MFTYSVVIFERKQSLRRVDVIFWLQDTLGFPKPRVHAQGNHAAFARYANRERILNGMPFKGAYGTSR